MHTSLGSCTEKILKLEQLLKATSHDRDRVQSQLDTSLSSASAHTLQTSQQHESTQKRIADLQKEISLRVQELQQTRQQLNSTSQSSSEATVLSAERIATLEQTVQDGMATVVVLKNENNELENQIAQLKKKIQEGKQQGDEAHQKVQEQIEHMQKQLLSEQEQLIASNAKINELILSNIENFLKFLKTELCDWHFSVHVKSEMP